MEPLRYHHLSSFLPSKTIRPKDVMPGKRLKSRKRQVPDEYIGLCYKSQYISRLRGPLSEKITAFFSFSFSFYGTFRAISTARLNMSPCLHLRPIDVVVFNGPLTRSNLGVGFVLRCFQHLSCPDAATRPCSCAEQPVHGWSVQHGPLVLVPVLLKSQRPQQIETELSHDVLNPARVPL